MNAERDCDWCGEPYVPSNGYEEFCCEECRREAEWDEKMSTQWGAM